MLEIRKAGPYQYSPSQIELFAEKLCQDFGGSLLEQREIPVASLSRHSKVIGVSREEDNQEWSLIVSYHRPSLFYEGYMGRDPNTTPDNFSQMVFESDDAKAGLILDPNYFSFNRVYRFWEILSIGGCLSSRIKINERRSWPIPPTHPFKDFTGINVVPGFLLAYETWPILYLGEKITSADHYVDRLGISWTGSLADRYNQKEDNLMRQSVLSSGPPKTLLRYSTELESSSWFAKSNKLVEPKMTSGFLSFLGETGLDLQSFLAWVRADYPVDEVFALIRDFLQNTFKTPAPHLTKVI